MDVHRSPAAAGNSPNTPSTGNIINSSLYPPPLPLQNNGGSGVDIRRNLFSAAGHSERSVGGLDVDGNGVNRVGGYDNLGGYNITNNGGSTPHNHPWQPLPNAPHYGRYPYAGHPSPYGFPTMPYYNQWNEQLPTTHKAPGIFPNMELEVGRRYDLADLFRPSHHEIYEERRKNVGFDKLTVESQSNLLTYKSDQRPFDLFWYDIATQRALVANEKDKQRHRKRQRSRNQRSLDAKVTEAAISTLSQLGNNLQNIGDNVQNVHGHHFNAISSSAKDQRQLEKDAATECQLDNLQEELLVEQENHRQEKVELEQEKHRRTQEELETEQENHRRTQEELETEQENHRRTQEELETEQELHKGTKHAHQKKGHQLNFICRALRVSREERATLDGDFNKQYNSQRKRKRSEESEDDTSKTNNDSDDR